MLIHGNIEERSSAQDMPWGSEVEARVPFGGSCSGSRLGISIWVQQKERVKGLKTREALRDVSPHLNWAEVDIYLSSLQKRI